MRCEIIFIAVASFFLLGCSGGQGNSEMAAEAYRRQDYASAFKLAAEHSGADIRSQRLLATLYFEGKGVQRNPQKAIDILTPLADGGDAKAQTLLAAIFIAPGPQKNTERALYYNEKAIEQGSAQANYNLGVIYLHGLTGEKNVVLATRYLTASSDLGSADAPILLGSLLSAPVERCQQFSLAASRGNSQGALGYARCLVQGDAKNGKDFVSAAYWYSVAASQGNRLAQANLGYLAEKGLGTAVNLAEAKKWYCLAKDEVPSAAIRLKERHLSC
ncbi:tetratricopeptide repeat protein [Serratia nevei]|uniref:tetratricopeptide repeat protein n=1 Tax=Serratia TaxID=613 RepID=UPI00098A9798|nr:tetratricopeptide repeat protein [Serratia marcescens]BEN40740.1 hypothetical protein SMKC049_25320 [Serratia marcescens]